MEEYLQRAKENSRLLDVLKEKCPEDFYEWRITIIFYTARHLINCLLKKNNKKIETDHKTFHFSINPKNPDRYIEINEYIYDKYYELYTESRKCRYEGFTTQSDRYQYLKLYYIASLNSLSVIADYLKQLNQEICLEDIK